MEAVSLFPATNLPTFRRAHGGFSLPATMDGRPHPEPAGSSGCAALALAQEPSFHRSPGGGGGHDSGAGLPGFKPKFTQ